MTTRPPFRVCYLVGKYPPQFGGPGIKTQRMLPELPSHGIVPSIVAYRPEQAPSTLPEGDLATVHRILDPGTGRLATIRRALQFRRHFREHRQDYDIVHSIFLGWEFLVNIRFFKSLGLPVVFEMVLLDGDDPLTLSREILGTIKLGLLRQVDAWIGIAGVFLPRVRAVGLPEDRFRLIYVGVDVDRYRPARGEAKRSVRAALGLPQGARIVVFAGTVTPRKGVDRLLRAWACASPEPGRDLLLIVGPATAEDGLPAAGLGYVEEIRRLAAAPGVAGTVRITGRVENVQDYLAAGDLFLFLSRQEGLGAVILEAQACGLPCVVSPLDGIAAEIVSEGRTGTIVPRPDDPGRTGAIVARLLSDPSLLHDMGEEARREAVARFSIQTNVSALETLYGEVLERSRAMRSRPS